MSVGAVSVDDALTGQLVDERDSGLKRGLCLRLVAVVKRCPD